MIHILSSKVINEELVAKITENANLRMKLGDIETTFEATVQVCSTTIR